MIHFIELIKKNLLLIMSTLNLNLRLFQRVDFEVTQKVLKYCNLYNQLDEAKLVRSKHVFEMGLYRPKS